MGIDIIKFSMFLLHALTVSHMTYFGETKLFPSFGFFIPAHFLWVVSHQKHQEKMKFSSRL